MTTPTSDEDTVTIPDELEKQLIEIYKAGTFPKNAEFGCTAVTGKTLLDSTTKELKENC